MAQARQQNNIHMLYYVAHHKTMSDAGPAAEGSPAATPTAHVLPPAHVVVDGAQIIVTVEASPGMSVTVAKRNLDQFDGQDPYFFDEGYTVAGSTGA